MLKDKKYGIKDTMLTKISFMHYMYWTRVMLTVVLEEIERVYIFYYNFFCFSLTLQIGKRSTVAKICGSEDPSPSGFYGPAIICFARLHRILLAIL